MGGAQQEPGPEDESAAQDPLAQMLQGFMSGQPSQGDAAPAGSEPAQEAPDLGGLLGGLLSGALSGGSGQVPPGYAAPAPASSGGALGNILGAILGGASPAMAADSFLAPIVNGLAEKLGLPPQVAQAVVAFVIGKLMEDRMQPGTDWTQPPAPSRGGRAQPASLEDVVARMNSGKRVPKTAIRRAGLAKELAAHTGLSRATAEASVQEVLNALGGQLGTGA